MHTIIHLQDFSVHFNRILKKTHLFSQCILSLTQEYNGFYFSVLQPLLTNNGNITEKWKQTLFSYISSINTKINRNCLFTMSKLSSLERASNQAAKPITKSTTVAVIS